MPSKSNLHFPSLCISRLIIRVGCSKKAYSHPVRGIPNPLFFSTTFYSASASSPCITWSYCTVARDSTTSQYLCLALIFTQHMIVLAISHRDFTSIRVLQCYHRALRLIQIPKVKAAIYLPGKRLYEPPTSWVSHFHRAIGPTDGVLRI